MKLSPRLHLRLALAGWVPKRQAVKAESLRLGNSGICRGEFALRSRHFT